MTDTTIVKLNNRIWELEKENEQLKKQLSDDFNQSNCITVQKSIISDLKKENVELKSKNRGLQSELQIFKEDVTHSNLLINKLGNENEQLKQFQEKVAEVIESKMGDNVCNDYKMEVLKEIWDELELDEVWFE